MRRFARALFTLCTVLSLVLLVATCVMWVRSYWRHEGKISKHGQLQQSVWSVLGGIRYLRVESAYTVRPEHEDFNWYSREVHSSDPVDRNFGNRTRTVSGAGFHYIEGDWREGFIYPGEPPMPYRAVVVPYWSIAVFAALLPAGWFFGFVRRRRRRRAGLCVRCGYDLRASPDQCPECGAPNARTAIS